MQLPTQTFVQLVRGQVAAIQGAAAGLIDFTIGAVLRAVVEAVSQVSLWLQGLIIKLLTVTRLATSTGTDVDSWGADFNLPRLTAVQASTPETFGRFSASLQAVVPIGATVETLDGAQQYALVVDTANMAYSAPLGGYVMPVGVTTVTVPVQATVAGSAANAAAGAISTITSAIPGVDYCTNANAVENGGDQESDAAYRARFIAYINSLSRAVLAAIKLAATSVYLNVDAAVVENLDYNDNPKPGFFYVVIDDGTGNPPASLLAAVGDAIEAVRGLTITYAVFGPVTATASIAMTITVAPTYDPAALVTAVTNALSSYIAGLKLGAGLPYTRLAQIAYDVSPGIIDVTDMQLNGVALDIPGDAKQVIKAGVIAVTPA